MENLCCKRKKYLSKSLFSFQFFSLTFHVSDDLKDKYLDLSTFTGLCYILLDHLIKDKVTQIEFPLLCLHSFSLADSPTILEIKFHWFAPNLFLLLFFFIFGRKINKCSFYMCRFRLVNFFVIRKIWWCETPEKTFAVNAFFHVENVIGLLLKIWHLTQQSICSQY